MDNRHKISELKYKLEDYRCEFTIAKADYNSYIASKMHGYMPGDLLDMWIDSTQNTMKSYERLIDETEAQIKELERAK